MGKQFVYLGKQGENDREELARDWRIRWYTKIGHSWNHKRGIERVARIWVMPRGSSISSGCGVYSFTPAKEDKGPNSMSLMVKDQSCLIGRIDREIAGNVFFIWNGPINMTHVNIRKKIDLTLLMLPEVDPAGELGMYLAHWWQIFEWITLTWHHLKTYITFKSSWLNRSLRFWLQCWKLLYEGSQGSQLWCAESHLFRPLNAVYINMYVRYIAQCLEWDVSWLSIIYLYVFLSIF